MVTSTTLSPQSGFLGSAQAGRLRNCKKAFGFGSIVSLFFGLQDFTNVPGAFKLKYDENGKEIVGKSTKQGLKELAKSGIKWASYCVAPVLIKFLPGAAVLAATAKAISVFASGFVLSSANEKILPTEQRLVEEACAEKGIDYKPFSDPKGQLA